MEILVSAKGKCPEGWGRDQKCSSPRNHDNNNLSFRKKEFHSPPKAT